MNDIKNIMLVRTTNTDIIIPPLGLLYIAAAIRKWGRGRDCQIKVIDFMAEGLNYERFGLNVANFCPDLIGFSSLDCEYTHFKRLSLLAQEAAPDSKIIAGGPLASNYHEDILNKGLADFVVIGEGEKTISELLDALVMGSDLKLIPGIAFSSDGNIIRTAAQDLIANLDEIAFPAWDLINIKRYSDFPNWNGILWEKYHAPVLTSRGCSFRCIYCHNFFGKKVRARSVDNLIAEITMLFNDYGIKEFHIIDDFFNFDLDRLKKICNVIIEKGLKVKIAFPNALRVDRMDKEAIILLKRAGAYKINYAIETASPRLQKLINKNLNLNKANEIINITSKEGIICFGFFMIGFPTESVAEAKQTIAFAVKSRLDTARFFKVIAHKNTELARYVSHKYEIEHFDDGERVDYYGTLANFSDMPTKTLNNLILDAHLKFYSRLSRVVRIICKYKNHFKAFMNITKLFYVTAVNEISNDESSLF